MPKLWNETIEAHRREVRAAILDTTWTLANERGPAAVRMSEVAEKTGIGRATLYKYFPDVESILAAWHSRTINRHLEQLSEVRESISDPGKRLRAVLEAYAHIQQRRVRHQHGAPHGSELATLLHRDGHVAAVQRQLHRFVKEVLADAARSGDIRTDVTADELATYCLHALTAASALRSGAAISRLVEVTLSGLREPAD